MLKNNLGYKVTTRLVDWGERVRRVWGSEWAAPDHGIYEFSNGRKFDSTDRGFTGFYGHQPNAINYMMVHDGHYPDMPSNDYLLQEDGSKVELL
jgi:hypothetical protein